MVTCYEMLDIFADTFNEEIRELKLFSHGFICESHMNFVK